MQAQMIWLILGAVFILLEVVVPGGIVIFLGVASLTVSGLVHFGVITDVPTALITWFIVSIVMMFGLRSFFMKYFEGDSHTENIDEDADSIGSIVKIIEDVLPHKEGRVKFRETTWGARSDEELLKGTEAVISGRDGNKWIIKSI
jgi:membrane protein implicated in regulation of membrane protease activity